MTNRPILYKSVLVLLVALMLFLVVPISMKAQDVPTLDYYFVAFTYKPEEMQAVQDAANAILVKNIGAKVQFHPMNFTEAPTKGHLVLQSGDPCDLMSFSQFNTFSPAVASGGLMPIDDLLKQYAPTEMANFTPEQLNAVKKDGKIYGAPIAGMPLGRLAFWTRKDLLDKYKFDWQKATHIHDWEPFFDAVLKGEGGKVIPLLSSDPYWGRQWFPTFYGYDPISESLGVPGARGLFGVKVDDPSTKVVAVPFTPEYKEAVTLARDWYNRGYFLKSVPIDSEMSAMRAQLKFAAFEFPNASVRSTAAMAANEWNNVPIITGFVQDRAIITTGNILGSVYGVCATSKHPTEAVKFIEEMQKNVELLNLFNHGIEGKDWVWVDKAKKIIGFPAGVDGNTVGWNPNTYWQFGDQRLVYLKSGDDVGWGDRETEVRKNAITSPIVGFVPDLAPIQNELAQVISAAKQYCEPVDKGLVDVEPGLKQCQDQIKAAGSDTIVAELQKQIDAWKAENKK
jgi:putative aldouronate transport system substrate-binding protein